MFAYKKFSVLKGIPEPIESQVLSTEDAPVMALLVAEDAGADAVLQALALVAAAARDRYDYDPLDSVW